MFILFNLIESYSQSIQPSRFYAELGTGTSIMKEGFANAQPIPNLSIKSGYNKSITDYFNLDLGIRYSKVTTKNELNFVSPYGTLINKNKLNYLQLQIISKLQLKRFAVGVGAGTYFTLNQKSEIEATLQSEIINTSNSFTAFQSETSYKDIGLTAIYNVNIPLGSKIVLNLEHNFLFIEGITPINQKDLRYLVLNEFTAGVKYYFTRQG